MTIDDTVPVLMNFLPREYADAIKVGQPIGTMGFPGELGVQRWGGRSADHHNLSKMEPSVP